MRLYRLFPATGEIQYPIRDKDGFFVLGSPMHGNEKHHKVRKVRVRDEGEMIALVRAGHSVRVGQRSGARMVRRNIYIDGARVT